MSGTPRVLTITFKIHVKKTKANVRGPRIQSAAEQIVNSVLTLLPRVFPWADRVEVDRSWSYDWWTPDTEFIDLPTSPENTSGASDADAADPAEDDFPEPAVGATDLTENL